MTTNHNHDDDDDDDDDDDASSRKRIKTCDNGGVALWSDLIHDVLLLVTMRLPFLHFSAFSKVCKSWRSLALANKNSFLVSRPPWSITISNDVNEKECYLEDFEGRKFKTIIPHSDCRRCVGLTCGYLIFFGREHRDFWLVNPITRHQLHFPAVPFLVNATQDFGVRGVLVFSPSKSGWLFFFLNNMSRGVWFSIAGEGVWNKITSILPILHILAFKGKIYTLHNHYRFDVGHVCELRLNPEPKLTRLKTENFPRRGIRLPEFVHYGEHLYVIQYISVGVYKVYELDFGEMKWTYCGKTKEEYAFFISHAYQSAAVKHESWWADTHKIREDRLYMAHMWYFPHECLNVITL